MTYVLNTPGNGPQAYPAQGSPYMNPGGGYGQNANSTYYPSYVPQYPQYPQYPPPAHNGYDPQNALAPVSFNLMCALYHLPVRLHLALLSSLDSQRMRQMLTILLCVYSRTSHLSIPLRPDLHPRLRRRRILELGQPWLCHCMRLCSCSHVVPLLD